jgi:hypothetical protein
MKYGRSGDQGVQVSLNPLGVVGSFGLLQEDCQNSRGIDHHQRGNPCSSYPIITSGLRSSRIGREAQRCAICINAAAGELRQLSSKLMGFFVINVEAQRNFSR